jgi:hypothetical protein
MMLGKLLKAYEQGDLWLAFDAFAQVTARTAAAAKRELKADRATARDREWNDRDDTCVPLAREIALLVAGQEPWRWDSPIEAEAVDQIAEMTMRELVLLGRAIHEAGQTGAGI